MAGAAAPAIRAALMFTIVATGTLLYRSANPLNQLCTAAFVMLLYEPAWLFAAGFQLSFLAILSITLFYAPIRYLLQPKHKALNWLWQSVALSLAAEILIAPLVAFYFHSFPASFLAANIIACLAMSAILVLGILLVLLAPAAPLAMALAWMITRITVLFHQAILFLQGFSPVALKQLQLSLPQLLLLYTFIAATAIFLIGRKKKAIWPAMAALLLFSLYSLHNAWQTATQRTFIVYNHKSGQAELLQSGSYQLLCGDTAESVAAGTTHIGYHCNHRSRAQVQQLILAGGLRILLPDRHINPAKPFPADIVILTAAPVDMALIKEKFRPRLIVLGGGLSRRQALTLKEDCGREGLACHDTREKGAYLLR
jgi:competence protein ComEC